MHIYDCCTRNGDHLVLLINTGNVHKQRILSLTTINTFYKSKGKGIEAQSKMMVAPKWWLFSQLQK